MTFVPFDDPPAPDDATVSPVQADESPSIDRESDEIEEPFESPPTDEPQEREVRRPRQSWGGRPRTLLRSIPKRRTVAIDGGAELHLLVLSCTPEETNALDLASGALIKLRVTWPEGHTPDLDVFDVVETRLAPDPERDDLAQPEAASTDGLPRQVGTLRGRHIRRYLENLTVPPNGPLLGFRGSAAPYWEFRGARPSMALIEPTRPRPQLLRRPADGTTWVRFGWERDDVWLPVEDKAAARALDAARRERLSGKGLAAALGFNPQYLLVSLTKPRDGMCYKVCSAILPRD